MKSDYFVLYYINREQCDFLNESIFSAMDLSLREKIGGNSMTYEEIVERVRDDYENADARAIYEHVAIQFNVEGEGSGIFYIEVSNRKVSVEPYDYYDKDALVVITSEALIAISDGKMTKEEAVEQGFIKIYGNMDKIKLMRKIVFKKNR